MGHQVNTNLPKLLILLIQANEQKQQQKYQEGIALYLRAIELFGEDGDLYTAIADCYFRLANNPRETGENFKEAVEWMKKSVALAPNDARFHALLAYYYQVGTLEYEQAADEYRKSLEINPNNVWSLVGAASLYGTPEEVVTLTEAIRWLETATQLDAENPNHYARLGELYHEADRISDAKDAWRRSLSRSQPLTTGYVLMIRENLRD